MFEIKAPKIPFLNSFIIEIIKTWLFRYSSRELHSWQDEQEE